MKIVICGSMTFSRKMIQVGNALTRNGHIVVLPKFVEEYAEFKDIDKICVESVKNKIVHDLIRDYYDEIKNADAILVVNENKNGINSYIGGNVFLEMGFAHVLNKKIFLLYNIPELSYKDEIVAMSPTVLDGVIGDVKFLVGRGSI